MKSVLISIQPKWCELIASGKKTVEVRKTKPKINIPFKCYIYCTKQRVNGEILLTYDKRVEGRNRGFRDEGDVPLAGKVIGEFICSNIDYHSIRHLVVKEDSEDALRNTCITKNEMLDYLNYERGTSVYNKPYAFYGWHISDLVIYDKPKLLCDFYKCGALSLEELADREELCGYCSDTGYGEYASYGTPNGPVFCEGAFCDEAYQEYLDENFSITRPPQSWCYVEERSEK